LFGLIVLVPVGDVWEVVPVLLFFTLACDSIHLVASMLLFVWFIWVSIEVDGVFGFTVLGALSRQILIKYDEAGIFT